MFFVFAYIFSQIQKKAYTKTQNVDLFYFLSLPAVNRRSSNEVFVSYYRIYFLKTITNDRLWKKLKLNSNSQRDLHDHDQGSQDKYFEANSKSQFPYVSTCYIWKRSQVGPKLKRCTFRSSHWTKNDFDGIYHFHENKLFGLTFKSCHNTFTIIWTVLREDLPTRLLRHRTKDNSALKGIWH